MLNNNKLLNKIEDSFKDVKLEDGVGYFQSICIDNLDNSAKIIAAKQKDNEFGEDWRKLLHYVKENKLDWFPCSFMDSKGIRYLLPILLILECKLTLNQIIKEMLLNTKQEIENIWNDVLDTKQREVIHELYSYWHNTNLKNLISYGMTKENAMEELRNNKSLENKYYNSQIIEILEMLENKSYFTK